MPKAAKMDGSDKLQWWQTRTFVVVMAVLSMVPLLWPDIPPLVDLPGHMGRYRVQVDLQRGDDDEVAQRQALEHQFAPECQRSLRRSVA